MFVMKRKGRMEHRNKSKVFDILLYIAHCKWSPFFPRSNFRINTWQKLSQPLWLLLQQAPPSKLQPALLFSSSHHMSLAQCGEPQLDVAFVVVVIVVVVVVVVVVVGVVADSKHSHFCKY